MQIYKYVKGYEYKGYDKMNCSQLEKRGRMMYIFEAALEYFISILVSGSFLATLTKELGISDRLTGILSSVISLGCLFQLLTITIRRRQVKKIVIWLSIANQFLFMLLYVVPLFEINKTVKIAVFVIFIFWAYVIYNFIHPKKIDWLMSMVEDKNRGRFTANKEIVSLGLGMVFSFLMGTVIDSFSEKGQTRTALAISAAVIFILMVLHTLTMVFTGEKDSGVQERVNSLQSVKDVFANKNVLQIAILFVLYYISTYISTPFYGTYQIGELGLNLKFISVITMCGSISRLLVSKFWGGYADKRSFAAMIEKCFVFLAMGQLAVIFAIPETGKIMFVIYQIFHGVALGGINSALINLIFDYVPVDKRANSLAVTQAVAGVVGFMTTLLISPLVSYIQNNGNTLCGIRIYAQQFITVIAFVFTIISIIYIRKVVMKQVKPT